LAPDDSLDRHGDGFARVLAVSRWDALSRELYDAGQASGKSGERSASFGSTLFPMSRACGHCCRLGHAVRAGLHNVALRPARWRPTERFAARPERTASLRFFDSGSDDAQSRADSHDRAATFASSTFLSSTLPASPPWTRSSHSPLMLHPAQRAGSDPVHACIVPPSNA
jgi:hypothetical protein